MTKTPILKHPDIDAGTTILSDGTKIYWKRLKKYLHVDGPFIAADGRKIKVGDESFRWPIKEQWLRDSYYILCKERDYEYRKMTIDEVKEWEAARASMGFDLEIDISNI